MRVLRFLALVAVTCIFTGLANAADFHMRVLDPPPPSYPTFPIFTTPFAVTFTPCVAGELPDGNTAEGCFAGHNESGQDWNNLQITFMNNAALASQTPNCATGPSDDIFSNINCILTPDNSAYILSFSNGDISNGDFFFITEDGVDPAAFGTGTAVVMMTPEPASVVLALSGAMLFGLLLYTERRSAGFSQLL
jgi:hypothetical protein